MDNDQLIDSACRLFAQVQEQLKVAIDRRLVPGSWTWEELEDRLRVVNRPEDGPGVDTYYLDREPLLRAYPIEAQAYGRAIRFTRRVRHLSVDDKRRRLADEQDAGS